MAAIAYAIGHLDLHSGACTLKHANHIRSTAFGWWRTVHQCVYSPQLEYIHDQQRKWKKMIQDDHIRLKGQSNQMTIQLGIH